MTGSNRSDEMTLGAPGQTMVGLTAFIKDGGGGRCKGCGELYATLYSDGNGPCCHVTATPDATLPDPNQAPPKR